MMEDLKIHFVNRTQTQMHNNFILVALRIII